MAESSSNPIFVQLENDVDVAFDPTAVFEDCLLDPPDLNLPLDNQEFETETLSIILDWFEVTNPVTADFYVLQISMTRDFRGPSVKGFRVDTPTISKVLIVGTDIFVGIDFFWRVYAYVDGACSSPPSEIRRFKINEADPLPDLIICDGCDEVRIEKFRTPRFVITESTFIAEIEWSAPLGRNPIVTWSFAALNEAQGKVSFTQEGDNFAVIAVGPVDVTTVIEVAVTITLNTGESCTCIAEVQILSILNSSSSSSSQSSSTSSSSSSSNSSSSMSSQSSSSLSTSSGSLSSITASSSSISSSSLSSPSSSSLSSVSISESSVSLSSSSSLGISSLSSSTGSSSSPTSESSLSSEGISDSVSSGGISFSSGGCDKLELKLDNDEAELELDNDEPELELDELDSEDEELDELTKQQSHWLKI